MRAEQIKLGATLRLKPARQEAYGRADAFVRVDGLIERPGYKVPWVWQENPDTRDGRGEFFAPSDFANQVN